VKSASVRRLRSCSLRRSSRNWSICLARLAGGNKFWLSSFTRVAVSRLRTACQPVLTRWLPRFSPAKNPMTSREESYIPQLHPLHTSVSFTRPARQLTYPPLELIRVPADNEALHEGARCGCPLSRNPNHAPGPGMHSTPNAALTGATSGSIVRPPFSPAME